MNVLPRREFFKTSGYLTIGFVLFGCNTEQKDETSQATSFSLDVPSNVLPDDSQIDAWLNILKDGSIQILTGRMELGQGLKVAIQQVAGEELNIEPQKIKVVLADTGLTPNEGYTSGSRGIERGAMAVRRAAAAAREHILKMAAQQWDASTDQLSTEGGIVNWAQQNKSIPFSALVEGKKLYAAIPKDVKLKPKNRYQWVGKPIPHPDMEKIVRGEALYVHDLRLPGMVHARVVRPPMYGAQVKEVDQSVAQMDGILKVVVNGSFLGVISEEEFQAVEAAEALREGTNWQSGGSFPSVDSWSGYLLEKSGEKSKTSTLQNSTTHYAVYSKPYTMHGSIGPSCAIAAFENDKLQMWSSTQGPYPLRSTISDLTGLAEDNIRVSGVRGSGCYGHNGADDVAADAAVLAMAFPGRPIRLQWHRHDEHQWEPYGSAMRMELAAELKGKKITKWSYDLWSDGHSTRPRGDASHFIAARHLEEPKPFKGSTRVGGGNRNSEPYYAIPSSNINSHHVTGPLRVSALRGLGAYANIFAIESFMEELAEKAGVNPLDFRITNSEDERAITVMKRLQAILAKEISTDGQGLGYAFSRYKNTAAYCAVAAKVEVDLENKKVTPLKMWSVLEAGEAINPDGLKNQTEGGLIQAASWTLKEEVHFDANEITSKDWLSYPIIRFDAIPETTVVVIDRPDLPPLGAGEAAQGPAAAAIANAVYAACGKRIRHIPIEKFLFSEQVEG